MTATLDKTPGSISPAQMRAINIIIRRHQLDRDAFKNDIGVDSLKELSKAKASDVLRSLGEDLPNEPGKAPRRRHRSTGAVRMITQANVQQIERLMAEYFVDRGRAMHWLETNFKVSSVRELATAERAGQVIAVLKQMHKRKDG